MDTSTSLTERARGRVIGRSSSVSRVLGHPAAYVITALVLLWIFAGPFITDPARIAPTKDPAYYSWRIETLVSEKPAALLGVRGAFGMFAGGYRISNAVLGAYFREIAGISLLKTTVLIMIGLPWITALVLAGFAYRQRRDPLIWHAVAFGSAGMFLTPPYVGYMDNVLCLFFLSAAIWFIGPSSHSWPARGALLLFIVLAGLTHPTTLAFFILTLGFIAAARLVIRGFKLRDTVRSDMPMLAVALLGGALTYVIWKAGIWGPSQSLSDAALPPPYSSSFFISRMNEWLTAMRPLLNGVLFALAAVILLAGGRRMVEDELPRVSLGWLLPSIGLFGFVAGATYPYYRFFNTTVSIPLLVGIGAYFALRFFLDWVEGGGIGWLGAIGVLAVAFVLVTNFTSGLTTSGWSRSTSQWISPEQQQQLSLLRQQLAAKIDPSTPVVFVVDDETSTFQIWGITKLSGNTSRYGLPRGLIDNGYEYLGSLDNYLAGQPTIRSGQDTYNKVSRAQMKGVTQVASSAGADPLAVVVQSFNLTGSNADVAAGNSPPPATAGSFGSGGSSIWVLNDKGLTEFADGKQTSQVPLSSLQEGSSGGILHILRILGALLLLLLPGWLAFRWAVPEGGLALGIGMVVALSSGVLILVGTLLLAVWRTPFTGAAIWTALIASAVVGALLRLRARLAPEHEADPMLL